MTKTLAAPAPPWVALAVLLACAAACDDDARPSADAAGPAGLIGPEGGTLEKHGAVLRVPAGALTEPTQLDLVVSDDAPVATPGDVDAVTRVFVLLPHGQVFLEAVTIELPLQLTPNGSVDVLRLADAADTAWTSVAGAQLDGERIVFTTTSFSYYMGVTPEVEGNGACPDNPALQLDSPWPMYRACQQLHGRSPAIGPAAEPGLAWSSTSFTAPVIAANGTVYVTQGTDLVGLSADGGEVRRVPLGAEAHGSPAILAGGSIAVPLMNGSLAMVLPGALDTDWSTPVVAAAEGELRHGVTVAKDGTLYVQSHDFAGGTVFANEVHAVSPAGELQWSSGTGPSEDGAVALGNDGSVYAIGYGALNSFSAAGTLRWSKVPTGPTFTTAIGSPMISPDGTIYFSVDADELDVAYVVAVTAAGTITTSFSVTDPYHLAVGAGGEVYGSFQRQPPVATSGLARMNVTGSGSYVWEAPVAGDGPAPVIDANGDLYAAGHAGGNTFVYAVTAAGAVKWTFTIAGDEDPLELSMGGDGTLYLVTLPDHKLRALR